MRPKYIMLRLNIEMFEGGLFIYEKAGAERWKDHTNVFLQLNISFISFINSKTVFLFS